MYRPPTGLGCPLASARPVALPDGTQWTRSAVPCSARWTPCARPRAPSRHSSRYHHARVHRSKRAQACRRARAFRARECITHGMHAHANANGTARSEMCSQSICTGSALHGTASNPRTRHMRTGIGGDEAWERRAQPLGICLYANAVRKEARRLLRPPVGTGRLPAANGQYQQPVPTACADSQCRQSVPTVSANSQCRQSVPAVSADSQCRQSVPLVSANRQCRHLGPAVSVTVGALWTHMSIHAV